MRLIENLIPPGGFHYYHGDVKLMGYSKDDIINIIKQYRAANNLPSGDAEADYLSYVCGNFPANCHAVQYYHETSPVPPSRMDELMEDVKAWSNQTLVSNKPIVLVSDGEAERRAKICLACSKNFTWKTKACAPCIQAVERNCALIRQTKETYTSSKLGGCLALRHDNRTAVWLDNEELNTANNLPSACWKNKQ